MNFCFIAALAAAAILSGNDHDRSDCSERHDPCKDVREEVRDCIEPEVIHHHCGCRRPWHRCW